MDRLRTLTPLILLCLCGLVWLEPVLPGAEAIRENLGEGAVPRFVTGLLCLFVLILFVERQHLLSIFEQMLSRLKQLQGQAPGGGGEPPVDEAEQQKLLRDAASILVAALESGEPEVRKNAAENLERMTGQKFGEDAARWRDYLAKSSG